MSLLTTVLLTVALGQNDAGLTPRDVIRVHVNPATGQVKPELQQATGWQTVHGFQWQMLVLDDQGHATPAKVDQVFATGTRFRIRVETLTDLHIYVLNLNSDGSIAPLYPVAGEQAGIIECGQTVQVPPGDDHFRFVEPAGKETFYVIAAPQPLNWVNPGKLIAKDAAGMKGLNDQRREILHRNQTVAEVLTQLKAKPELRSKNVELCPPPGDGGQQVLFASPTPNDTQPFMDVVVLTHR